MYMDVKHLMAFYEQPIGRIIRPIVNAEIRKIWPALSDRRLLGIGYPLPYLLPLQKEAERTLTCMPAAQGVTNWPKGKKNTVCIAEEDSFPFDDASIDNVLIVHAIEMTRHPEFVLREVSRILAPAGRVIIITSNRSGLWARTESSPFGYGHPYSRGQLSGLLGNCDFQVEKFVTTLHVPPINSRYIVRSARILERFGRRFWSRLGGLILVEAKKCEHNEIPVNVKELKPTRILKPAFATSSTMNVSESKKLPSEQQ